MQKWLLSLLLFLFTPIALADQINKIIYFGDSLSDNGNLYRQTKKAFLPIPKSPPYYKGRFSNGKVWTDDVSEYFTSTYPAEITEIQNYAVGGAVVMEPQTILGELRTYLREEIDLYFKTHRADDQTLYVIWIGANDYMDLKYPCNIDAVTTHVVNDLTQDINTLINAGGKYFLIFNLPDISRTPLGTAKPLVDQQLLHNLVITHNNKLNTVMQSLKANPNVHIVFHDIYSDFEELYNNPVVFSHKYNQYITDTTYACWNYGYILLQQISNNIDMHIPAAPPLFSTMTAITQYQNSSDMREAIETAQFAQLFPKETPCGNPEQHAFWDKIHPTTAAHQIIAQIAEKALQDENIK